MRDALNEAYKGCQVGDSKWVTLDATGGETLEDFQCVLHSAEVMQTDGLIHIQEALSESYSGKRLIDRIKFTRLK